MHSRDHGKHASNNYTSFVRTFVHRYKRAITQKGRISFSIPYEDAFGAGAVITMSKTLLAGRYVGHWSNLNVRL